jgi:hypothetical protein
MKTRNFALCALGLAAAITFGGAATASAQARSDTRIPVRKDQPAPEPPRVDTIRIVRVDTVTLRGRVDTVTIRTRPDTIVHMQMLPVQPLPGWYGGIGAGVAVPYSSYRAPNKDGFDLNGEIGWFPHDAAFGLRLTGDGIWYNARKAYCQVCDNPSQFQLGLDLLLRFPLDRTSHINPVLYFFGGGGLNWYSNFIPYINSGGSVVTAGADHTVLIIPGIPATVVTSSGSGGTFGSYDAGLGLDFNVATSVHMYVQGKFTQVSTNGGPSRTFPIIAGFKFYSSGSHSQPLQP